MYYLVPFPSQLKHAHRLGIAPAQEHADVWHGLGIPSAPSLYGAVHHEGDVSLQICAVECDAQINGVNLYVHINVCVCMRTCVYVCMHAWVYAVSMMLQLLVLYLSLTPIPPYLYEHVGPGVSQLADEPQWIQDEAYIQVQHHQVHLHNQHHHQVHQYHHQQVNHHHHVQHHQQIQQHHHQVHQHLHNQVH